MPPPRHPDTGALWATIRRLAGRAQGCSTVEVAAATGVNTKRVGKACTDLRLREELVVWRISHRRARYFATEALMVAFKAESARVAAAKYKAARAQQDPVFPPDAKVVIPKGLKVQVGPRYEPRNTSFEFPFLNQRKAL